jgi:hypothetical protein
VDIPNHPNTIPSRPHTHADTEGNASHQ